ncbi:MAG: ChaN family lipoprotein [Phycisphaerales bacterium]|jgi:uncharacterized iron-regulated protein|nr:ChaN family lipoprotein [Phycisphaerales bacterium]
MSKTTVLCSIAIAVVASGCASVPVGPTSVFDVDIDVRAETTIVQVNSGDIVGWDYLVEAIDGADVVLLGELHDHAVGHAVQLAVVEDVMDRYPGSALALEMLERDEQLRVDDYMEDFIDAKTLAAITQSKNWGGDGGWEAWYQPIIDAAKLRGGRVVAANAPRRYVRLARTDGYERIEDLPKERRVFVDYPEVLSSGRYRERFWEYASHDEDESEEVDVTTIDPDDPMLPTFKSMQAWDATMAQSIVDADPTKKQKVVLLVGQFHVEYDGGVVQELRNRMPSLSVLVVSIQKTFPEPEDEWQAEPQISDIMIVENASD